MNKYEDVHLNQLGLQRTYYSKFINGDVNGAREVLTQNPSLKGKIINEVALNEFVNVLTDIETKFNEDTVGALATLLNVRQTNIDELSFRGMFQGGVRYKKFNLVIKDTALLFFFADMTTDDPLPVSVVLELEGNAGNGGTNVIWKNPWMNDTEYAPLDMVEYQNGLYVARIANTNARPDVSNDKWCLATKVHKAQLYTYYDDEQDIPVGGVKITLLNES